MAVALAKDQMRNLEKEELHVAFLDKDNRVLEIKTFDVLQPNLAIYEEVKRLHAHSIVILHNHPDGEQMPYDTDIRNNIALYNLLGTLDVPILDHIIITKKTYYSFYTRETHRFKE